MSLNASPLSPNQGRREALLAPACCSWNCPSACCTFSLAATATLLVIASLIAKFSCYSVVLAGAGINAGIVHGRSDRRAAFPVDGAVSPQDLVTTIYHCLGITADTELTDGLGRPMRLCQGTVIQSVLA
jgi:hypothetical protein